MKFRGWRAREGSHSRKGCDSVLQIPLNRPALSGGTDLWRMEWPFSRVRKIFFRGRNFQQNPGISAERAIFAKFQAPKFENSEPEKTQFYTPNHSIPPLDSLLLKPLLRKPSKSPAESKCSIEKSCHDTWTSQTPGWHKTELAPHQNSMFPHKTLQLAGHQHSSLCDMMALPKPPPFLQNTYRHENSFDLFSGTY